MGLIPNRVPVGPADILCEQDRYTVLATGQVISKDAYNQPFNGNALAHALRYYGFPGVVVRTRGNQHRGLSINNPNGNLANTVKWIKGNVDKITVIGDEPNMAARIGAIELYNQTGDVRFEGLTMTNHAGAYCPFIVTQNSLVGRITLYDLVFLPQDPTAWGGKGMKWNIRGHGVARSWDCRNITFHEAVEHGGYIDNHLEDSYFVQIVGGGMGRTLLQLTNRSESGPASQGKLVIARCVSNNIGSQGGSDYTIVGNGEGPIYFLQNKSFGSKQGAFVHWTDQGHGAYLTPNGFSTSQLIIHDFEVVSPQADRDHVMISGIEDVIVSAWDITGNRTAIALNTSSGGGINNGTVTLATGGVPASQAPGWHAAQKMKNGKTVLTNAQIDALTGDRG